MAFYFRNKCPFSAEYAPDLASLKKNAEDEGIPYQTLISSVLHKYLAGRLYEDKHIRKSIELLTRKQQVT